MLDAKSVRQALINMIEQGPDHPALKREINTLKSAPVEKADGSAFLIGNWYCDPKELTFVVTFVDLPFMLEYSRAIKSSRIAEVVK